MNSSTAVRSDDARDLDIRVHFLGRRRSRAIARFAVDRFARALAGIARSVDVARVRVRDVNGQRGGVDQQCSVELRLSDGGHLHLTELAASPHTALHRLAARLRRLLRKRADRRRG